MTDTSDNSNGNSIVADHLVKKFGELVAVNDISFSVGERELFGLLGPNGAGKDHSDPHADHAHAAHLRHGANRRPRHRQGRRRSAPGNRRDSQALTSDPELTAEENMLLHAKLFGVPAAQRRELVARLLEEVDLSKFGKTFVRNFSGGMRRRLEIARGLVHSPKILFLDEPTTGLDPVSRTNVWEMIRRLREQSKLTIVLTTHYMDEADKLCDRIAIVDHGRLAALDTPTNLKDSIPGADTVEAEFANAPADWLAQLEKISHAASVTQHDHVVHIASNDGPVHRRRADGSRQGARRHRAQSHGAGHDARRRLSAFHRQRIARCRRNRRAPRHKSSLSALMRTSQASGRNKKEMKIYRVAALIERDMRKFLRSPAQMMASMVFPLLQLVVLGYAFGGHIKGVTVAVVDQDRTAESRASQRNDRRNPRRPANIQSPRLQFACPTPSTI